MRKVISIDGIALDNSCFISSEFDADDFIGKKSVAIDGSSIMFVLPKGAMTKDVQIYSKKHGWILESTKELLMASADSLPKIVVFDDTSEGTYYYDHTKIPMKFSQVFEGSLWYTVEINLLKG